MWSMLQKLKVSGWLWKVTSNFKGMCLKKCVTVFIVWNYCVKFVCFIQKGSLVAGKWSALQVSTSLYHFTWIFNPIQIKLLWCSVGHAYRNELMGWFSADWPKYMCTILFSHHVIPSHNTSNLLKTKVLKKTPLSLVLLLIKYLLIFTVNLNRGKITFAIQRAYLYHVFLTKDTSP